MKLINYNYGYLFDCVIEGKIVVSKREWAEIRTHLLRTTKWVDTNTYAPFYKNLLREDMERGIKTKDGTLYNIRVSATQEVVRKWGLEKYKRANYMFLVLD